MLGFARYVEFDATGTVRSDASARTAERALEAVVASSRESLYACAAAILLCAVIGGFLTYPTWRRWPWVGLVTFAPAQVALVFAILAHLGGDQWLFAEVAAGSVVVTCAIDLVRGQRALAGKILLWSNLSLGMGALLLRAIAGLR